jgi:hypothetical protein
MSRVRPRSKLYGYKIEGVHRRIRPAGEQNPALRASLAQQTFGAASPGRRLSALERAAVEARLREQGVL